MKAKKSVPHLESDSSVVQKNYNKWIKDNTPNCDRRGYYITKTDIDDSPLSENQIQQSRVLEIDSQLRARADELNIPYPNAYQIAESSIGCQLSPTQKVSQDSANVLPARVANLRKLRLTTITYTERDLILGKYLSADKLERDILASGKRFVLLCAGLGLGKSTATAEMMSRINEARGVAISHRKKLVNDLSAKFNAMVYNEIKDGDGGQAPERLATTIHSLSTIESLEQSKTALNRGTVVIDEIESVCNEFNQPQTMRSPHKAIAALKRIVDKAGLFIGADAHVGEQSIHLLSLLGVNTDDILLIDVQRPELTGFDIEIVTQGDDKQITPIAALTNRARDALQAGKKVTITGLSKEKLKQVCRELAPFALNPMLITGDSTVSEVEALNADSYQYTDLVILSPAMTTGISFDGGDGYNHADEVLVHASNYSGTGSPYDVLQALLRDRKPGKITVFYESGDESLDTPERIALKDAQWSAALMGLLDINEVLRSKRALNLPDELKVNGFMFGNRAQQASDKLYFLSILKDELAYKGARVSVTETAIAHTGDVTAETLRVHKEAMRHELLTGVSEAIKLTEDTDTDNLDSELLRHAEKRARVERETCVDLDKLSTPDKLALVDAVLPEHGSGILSPVRNIERVYSDQKKVKAVIDAALGGVSCFDGDKPGFMEAGQSRKVFWPDKIKYTQLALKALTVGGEAGALSPALSEIVISDSLIKSRKHPAYSLARSLKSNPEPAIRAGLVNITTKAYQVKNKPAKFIADILFNLFGVKVRKKRGKSEWIADLSGFEKVLKIVNDRAANGVNGIDEYYQRIQDYKESAPARQKRKAERDTNSYVKVSSFESGLRDVLDGLGRLDLLVPAMEYMEPYEARINSGKMGAAMVGVSLLKFIENHDPG